MRILFGRKVHQTISILLLTGVVLAAAGIRPLHAGPAQNPASPEQPFVVEYYYKAKWGFADEFIRLFKKNHLPVLKKEIESGRMLSVTATAPRYHGTEDGRWDYRVTIVFKNVAAAHAQVDTDAITRALFPDQETYRREEQRRFEILLAHWDLPIVPVNLDK